MRRHDRDNRIFLLLTFLAAFCVIGTVLFRMPAAGAKLDSGKKQAFRAPEDGPTPTPYDRIAPKELPKKYTPEESDKEVRATRLPAIRLDGRIEDAWNVCEEYALENPVYGESGASAKFRAFSDKNKLYLCIEVKDDTPMRSNEVPTRCDSVEIYLNEDGSKPEKYHAGDSHYIFLRNGSCVERSGADLRLAESAVTETEDGYIMEISISWSLAPEDRGENFGLDIRVNDSHTEGSRDYIIQWSDTSMNTHENLSRVGTMKIR